MIVVIVVYLIMAAPLRGMVQASLSGRQGEALIRISAGGICFVRRTGLWANDQKGDIGASQILMLLKNRNIGKHTMRPLGHLELEKVLFWCAKIDSIRVDARIGLEEAWSTALAAGGFRASVLSMLGMLRKKSCVAVNVVPEFSSACFCIQVGCIFSVTAGDIMLSIIRTAGRRASGKGIVHAAASHRKPHGDFYGKHTGNGRRQYRHRRSG
ncbi:MAG: hypothetical protein IKU34_05210 [Clostridia bacterium]|nr:hypothetical protein [Clostridia bacterium]